MYSSLKRELSFNAHFLDWPQYQGETSFKEVAERIIAENPINKNDVVGGSSLGGMIALEISMILNTNTVVLMGSALKPVHLKLQFALFLAFGLQIFCPISSLLLLEKLVSVL